MFTPVVDNADVSLEQSSCVAPSKAGALEKEEVWEQLTEEGTSGSSDSENDSSLHFSGSETDQSGESSREDTDCISGLVSSSTSDNEQDGSVAIKEPPTIARKRELAPPPGLMPEEVQRPMQRPQYIATTQRRSRKVPLAEALSSKLLQVSAGRPVKVWLSPDCKPHKALDANIPAKKRPVFQEHAGKEKKLDPTIPAKKHISSWLLKEALGDTTCFASSVSTKPGSPKPPRMPVRVAKAAQAWPVALTAR